MFFCMACSQTLLKVNDIVSRYGFEYDGLEPFLSHTEKSCIAPYYRQFSTIVKIKFIKLIPFFLARGAFGLSMYLQNWF